MEPYILLFLLCSEPALMVYQEFPRTLFYSFLANDAKTNATFRQYIQNAREAGVAVIRQELKPECRKT